MNLMQEKASLLLTVDQKWAIKKYHNHPMAAIKMHYFEVVRYEEMILRPPAHPSSAILSYD